MAPYDVQPPADSPPPGRRARRLAEQAAAASTPSSRRAALDAERTSRHGATAGPGRRRRHIDPGRPRRGPRFNARQKSFAVAAVAATAVTAIVNAVSTGPSEALLTRTAFSTSRTGAWFNDTQLGTTSSSDQYAQAKVSGLTDGQHNAGFAMRYAGRDSEVLVAVSGTGWDVRPSGSPELQGSFAHASSGQLRVEVAGQSVRILWNGQLVTTQALQGQYPGLGVVATVWQSTPTVRMSHLEASSLGDDSSITTEPSPDSSSSDAPWHHRGRQGSSSSTSTSSSSSSTTSSTSSRTSSGSSGSSGGRGWLSGASGDDIADGAFGSWRGTAATVAGTWDDTDATVQQAVYSICGGQYSSGHWNGALDMAVGAIFENQGESWAAAATGAYNDRWRAMFTAAKQCWGSRDPSKLFIRFGHEMNLSSSNWAVQAGQESDFVQAFIQFSNVRYQVFPGVQLVLSFNDGSSGGMGDVTKMIPGKDSQGRATVNVLGVDSYNSWPHCTTLSSCQSKFDASADGGGPLGIETWRQLAQAHGLPFSVDEYANDASGSDGGGGDAPAFFQAFFDWAKAHSGDVNAPQPGQLLYEVLFNDWDQYALTPSTEQPAGAAEYRSLPWGQG